MTAHTDELADPVFVDDRLSHWAETNPDGEAFTYLDRTWTWAEWNDRVRRLAGALKALGVRRGDVVSFLDKNHPACVELTMAALAGLIVLDQHLDRLQLVGLALVVLASAIVMGVKRPEQPGRIEAT